MVKKLNLVMEILINVNKIVVVVLPEMSMIPENVDIIVIPQHALVLEW
jgi:hypothetical protein